MTDCKATPDIPPITALPPEEVKPGKVKSVPMYALMYLPTASYIKENNLRVALYRSKEKAMRSIRLLNKYGIGTTADDKLDYTRLVKNPLVLEVVHVYTLVTFPNHDKLLHLYTKLPLTSIVGYQEQGYFRNYPERIIYHENRS